MCEICNANDNQCPEEIISDCLCMEGIRTFEDSGANIINYRLFAVIYETELVRE
jgi:hypothetical protein